MRDAHAMRVLSFDCGGANLAHCIVSESASGSLSISHWNNVDLTSGKKVSISVLIDNLVNYLKKFEHETQLLEITGVVIEQQPPANTRMKCMSHCIQAFYSARCIKNRFVSAKQTHKILNMDTAGASYRQRKKAAVVTTTSVLAEIGTDDEQGWFRSQRKQDDLADCFLQAYAAWFSKRRRAAS